VSGVDLASAADTREPETEGISDVTSGTSWFSELFSECVAAAAEVGDDRMKVEHEDVELWDSEALLAA